MIQCSLYHVLEQIPHPHDEKNPPIQSEESSHLSDYNCEFLRIIDLRDPCFFGIKITLLQRSKAKYEHLSDTCEYRQYAPLCHVH